MNNTIYNNQEWIDATHKVLDILTIHKYVRIGRGWRRGHFMQRGYLDEKKYEINRDLTYMMHRYMPKYEDMDLTIGIINESDAKKFCIMATKHDRFEIITPENCSMEFIREINKYIIPEPEIYDFESDIYAMQRIIQAKHSGIIW